MKPQNSQLLLESNPTTHYFVLSCFGDPIINGQQNGNLLPIAEDLIGVSWCVNGKGYTRNSNLSSASDN